MVYCTCFAIFSLCSTLYFISMLIHIVWVIHFNLKIVTTSWILCFIYPFTCWWTFNLLPFFSEIAKNSAMNILLHALLVHKVQNFAQVCSWKWNFWIDVYYIYNFVIWCQIPFHSSSTKLYSFSQWSEFFLFYILNNTWYHLNFNFCQSNGHEMLSHGSDFQFS